MYCQIELIESRGRYFIDPTLEEISGNIKWQALFKNMGVFLAIKESKKAISYPMFLHSSATKEINICNQSGGRPHNMADLEDFKKIRKFMDGEGDQGRNSSLHQSEIPLDYRFSKTDVKLNKILRFKDNSFELNEYSNNSTSYLDIYCVVL